MDLRQLRHFVAVLENGNMLRAAKAINVTQPALSKSIRNLELQLGVRLLDRGPRGVNPTLHGQRLFDRAKLILNQARKAEEEIHGMGEGVHGHINIGFGANFAGFMVPQAVLRVISDYPEVTASVVSRPFDELLPMLKQGELDLAVVVFPPEPPEPDFVYEPLIVSEYQCVCKPDHPLVGTGNIGIAQLKAHDWILFDRPMAMKTLFNGLFLDQDMPPPVPVIQTSSLFFMKAALRQGNFLSYVQPGLVYDELETGRLVVLPADLPAIRSKAGIVYRSSDVFSAPTAKLIGEFRKIRDELGASDAPFGRCDRAAE